MFTPEGVAAQSSLNDDGMRMLEGHMAGALDNGGTMDCGLFPQPVCDSLDALADADPNATDAHARAVCDLAASLCANPEPRYGCDPIAESLFRPRER